MSSDRRAIVLLLLLGAAGVAVRLATGASGAPGAIAYRPAGAASGRSSLDSVTARAARLARPLKRGEKIDLDAASAEEIGRLPRVGAGLAARIVADRDEHGPFGSLSALDRVSGIGPSALKLMGPYATFSGRSAPRGDDGLSIRPSDRVLRPSDAADLVSLNTATADELDQLPGIGPAKARAIVEDRKRRGRYLTLDDLSRVPGMRASVIQGLKGRVKVP